ncbi:MAG: shikimate kinase [Treponema sp.]|jgi:shikimate kinase|nr:shikimate kinase [Treponema sp.]
MQFIVLLGPKHSGKTSAGKELAAILSGGFVDLDNYITQRTGKSPRALYIEGPDVFKKAEAEALAVIFEPAMAQSASPLVIAAGGGLVDNPDALPLLKKNAAAISVFLDVSAQTAWERIRKAGELPPFLKTENPEETHRSLHERRAAAYRHLASLVIKADDKSSQEIAREIVDGLH